MKPSSISLAFAALLLVTSLLLASCGAGPTPFPTVAPLPTRERTPTPVPGSDEEAILMLIDAESEGVVQQDIDRLEDIWSADGILTDANHTPDDPGDDEQWKGWDKIRDRYVNIVFPSAPTVAQAKDVNLTIEGDAATATSTTQIGNEVSPGGDMWTFAKKDGGWNITSLTFNLESK
jgi:hypothetical protein